MSRNNCRTSIYIVASLFFWLGDAQAGWFDPDCDMSEFNGSKKLRHVDQYSSFSITTPTSWSVKKKKEGGYSEMILKSEGACKITILISSRPLEQNEISVTTIQLIDSMLKSSLDHLRSQGHKIMNYGKYKEFKPGWPSFVIVSGGSGGNRISTSYGTVVKNRNFSILALTRNNQHSEDLANILRNVIDSVEIF
ncbi:hypothetical protein MNBD_GAMMA23-1300 [hydrothermal vent metagenome]|uniref:Uncharacterized protein n=1 Tax=hydrothermal vent metagenome TaxID=652676 RepID=A0A3B1ABF4_9ZZZZ